MPDSHEPKSSPQVLTLIQGRGEGEARLGSLQTLIDGLPDPVWLASLSGKIHSANQAAVQAYGYRSEEFQQLNLELIFAPEEGDRFQKAWREARKHGYAFLESVHRRKSGQDFPGEVRFRAARLRAVEVWIITARDVSDNHLATSAFRDSQERFRKIFEGAAAGMATILPQGFLLQVNPAFADFIGYPAAELMGRQLLDLTHPDDRESLIEVLNPVSPIGCESVYLELRFLCRGNQSVWGELSLAWVANDDGESYAVCLLQDSTRRKAMEEVLRERASLYRNVLRNVHEVIFQATGDGSLTFINTAWESLTGDKVETSIGRRLQDFFIEEDRDGLSELFCQLSTGEKQRSCGEARLLNRDGQGLWVSFEIGVQPGAIQPVLSGVFHDVQRRKETEEQLEQERTFLQSVIDGVADPLLVLTPSYQLLLMNQAARQHAHSVCPLPGENVTCYALMNRDDSPCSGKDRPCPLVAVKRTGRPATMVQRHTSVDGELKIYQVQASPLRDERGGLQAVIETFSDVTGLVLAEQKLREKERRLNDLAETDQLTRLPNRAQFYQVMQTSLVRAEQQGKEVSLLLLDLDRFTTINESLGHQLGDRLLCEVAERLRSCLRDSDLIARLGGDEFVIVINGLQETNCIERVANKILDALRPELMIDGYRLFVTGSIGISNYPVDGRDAAELLRAADAALFLAKQHGRNTFQHHNPEISARSRELLLLENSLRDAIDQEQLILHYQPQFDLYTGFVTGVEGLIRWQHPQQGMISPGDFIPLAEETGLIVPMGDWVLHEACRQNQAWIDAGWAPIRVSVNISARQFRETDLLASVCKILEETGLDPRLLELEITESMIMDDVDVAIHLMEQLTGIGVHFALDDFGTGYSSLAHLKRFPLSNLKIDRSFVMDMEKCGDDAEIVGSVINLAHSLNIQVVAEGIETEGQYRLLKERGCELGQGFLMARPTPGGKVEQFFRQAMQGGERLFSS